MSEGGSRDEVPPERASFRSFEKMGEVAVRAKLITNEWQGTTALEARLWVAHLDGLRDRAKREDEERKRNEELALTERATTAAERAAEASERAAVASERSAHWTRGAAIAAAVAAVAAAASTAWPWIATVWSLPGAPK